MKLNLALPLHEIGVDKVTYDIHFSIEWDSILNLDVPIPEILHVGLHALSVGESDISNSFCDTDKVP